MGVDVGDLSTSAISKQEDFKFKASLGYTGSLRTGQSGYKYPVLKTKQIRKQQQKRLYIHYNCYIEIHTSRFHFMYFFIMTNFQGWGWYGGPRVG